VVYVWLNYIRQHGKETRYSRMMLNFSAGGFSLLAVFLTAERIGEKFKCTVKPS